MSQDPATPSASRRSVPTSLGEDGWPRFEIPPRVAFLDVDGTLLPHTTSFLFARHLRGRRLIGRSSYLWTAWYGLRHRLGRLDYKRLAESSLQALSRVPLAELERLAYESFVELVRPRLFAGLVDHLNQLRQQGTSLVLLSSSPDFVIAPLGLYLSCEDRLTTPLRLARGRIVGLGEGPLCYGPGKLECARQWAAQRRIPMDDTTAYADNWSDRFLLEQVGHPVAVSPRTKLERLARARGWTIVRPAPPHAAPTKLGTF